MGPVRIDGHRGPRIADIRGAGVFLIRPDQTLYAASIQTVPFARPHFDEILGAVQYVSKNNYPAARGTA